MAQSSPFDLCPVKCGLAGHNPSNWTYLHGERALRRCNETILFDTAIYTPVGSPDSHVTFRACTVSETVTNQGIEKKATSFAPGEPTTLLQKRANNSAAIGCLAGAQAQNNVNDVHLMQWVTDESSAGSVVAESLDLAGAESLEAYLDVDSNCQPTILFARSGTTVFGLYVGAEVQKRSAASIVRKYIDVAKHGTSAKGIAAQICKEGIPSTWMIGIYAESSGNITAVHETVKRWSDAECLTNFDTEELWHDTEISIFKATDRPSNPGVEFESPQSLNSTAHKRSLEAKIYARADCRAIQVTAGDGCYSLSQRCGVSETEFELFNTKVANLCTTLKPAQWVCCSTGDLLSFAPKPESDGSCATYTIQANDACFDIGEKHFINTTAIDAFNKNTWGWAGCTGIQPGQKICVSSGSPPMPAAIAGAVCGPQVQGTLKPTDGTKLEMLNPCPLNVCCNVWGQCGMTKDFCIESPADTGAPGTSKPGMNACISNCGMDIVNNNEAPASFAHVAYFEAWNTERECLSMDVADIDTSKYTHIHFAFGEITTDYKVDISKVSDQFSKMKSMTGIKRILSIGGWAFSVEAPTYSIFREGVTAANRATLATNVVAFINEQGLDGVDFDWEYPSAPDLPGIPAGALQAGEDYLEFIKIVKRGMPSKSVSIAAPTSYW
jgi:hypothetical protein